MKTPYLHTPILPSERSSKDQHRAITLAISGVVAALVLGLLFWITMRARVADPAPPVADSVADTQRAQMIASLKESDYAVSPKDQQVMVAELKKSKASITEAERLEMITQLKTSQ